MAWLCIVRYVTYLPTLPRSINEKGLYDYLLINDDLDEAVRRLRGVADRAHGGLDPEPNMVPERVVLEDVSGCQAGLANKVYQYGPLVHLYRMFMRIGRRIR
jgi:hypothetical protein